MKKLLFLLLVFPLFASSQQKKDTIKAPDSRDKVEPVKLSTNVLDTNYLVVDMADTSFIIVGDTITLMKKIIGQSISNSLKNNAAEEILQYIKIDGTITNLAAFQLAVIKYLQLKRKYQK